MNQLNNLSNFVWQSTIWHNQFKESAWKSKVAQIIWEPSLMSEIEGELD